jgi:hypothetical protein
MAAPVHRFMNYEAQKTKNPNQVGITKKKGD